MSSAGEPVNVFEYERLAEERLDQGAYDYLAGGAGDELTLRDNLAAFGRWQLRPRVLVGLSEATTDTTVLGAPVSMPVVLGPAAFQRLAPPGGGQAAAHEEPVTVFRIFDLIDEALTWRDVEELASLSDLPVVVKGVLTAEDARLAADNGAAGVIVSNHGGRQLDGVPAALDALPEVVEAVESKVEVMVDGGVRRGVDVVKALALGAGAVLIARPFLWGLAVDGEAGVRRVLELLREEVRLALALAGCTSPREVTRAHVQRAPR